MIETSKLLEVEIFLKILKFFQKMNRLLCFKILLIEILLNSCCDSSLLIKFVNAFRRTDKVNNLVSDYLAKSVMKSFHRLSYLVLKFIK